LTEKSISLLPILTWRFTLTPSFSTSGAATSSAPAPRAEMRNFFRVDPARGAMRGVVLVRAHRRQVRAEPLLEPFARRTVEGRTAGARVAARVTCLLLVVGGRAAKSRDAAAAADVACDVQVADATVGARRLDGARRRLPGRRRTGAGR